MRVSKGIPVSALPPQCLALNPQLARKKATSSAPEPPRACVRMPKLAPLNQKATLTRGESPLERKFTLLWGAVAPDIVLVRQHRFAVDIGRKWAFDFAHLGSRVAIECVGVKKSGVSGHQTVWGVINDNDRLFEAALLGWIVIPLTRDRINAATLARIRDFIRARI